MTAQSAVPKTGARPTSDVAAALPVMAVDGSSTPANPIQQVLAALQGLAQHDTQDRGTIEPSSVTGTDGAAAVTASQAGTVASGSGSREVLIQLDPEHLGTVSIKIRMVADKVDVRIEVANGQTLDLLNKDRHVLSAAIEAAGGTRDALAMSAAPRSDALTANAQPGGLDAKPGFNRQPGGSFLATAGGGSGQRNDRATGPDHSNNSRDSNHDLTADTQSRSMDNGLYV